MICEPSPIFTSLLITVSGSIIVPYWMLDRSTYFFSILLSPIAITNLQLELEFDRHSCPKKVFF